MRHILVRCRHASLHAGDAVPSATLSFDRSSGRYNIRRHSGRLTLHTCVTVTSAAAVPSRPVTSRHVCCRRPFTFTAADTSRSLRTSRQVLCRRAFDKNKQGHFVQKVGKRGQRTKRYFPPESLHVDTLKHS